ncbi:MULTISPECIES: phosphate signaling complex protein PhoU [Eubacteriales]|uniref:phosphate signaling complex protein PhoU n=1 Tax=Eubacteriales TaxID=186802 RepID=UPI001105A838|nr:MULTISPECIES: phosphate signaling complex protein PhoU [Eubacteriales]
MRNKFDMQLELLNEQLTRMGELCELAINRVTKALVDGNLDQAKKVMSADEEIDQMEKDIERLCLKLLLQQQPVAKDLRQISAALKMITDMERIGDQTADIAEIIISAGMSEAGDVKKIEEMSSGVARMVNDSVTAYVERDLELARKVMEADDNIDKLFDEIRASIIKLIAEGNKGEQGVDLVMISKYLERIGDHATNIAEWVEFSITGVHKGAQAVEA